MVCMQTYNLLQLELEYSIHAWKHQYMWEKDSEHSVLYTIEQWLNVCLYLSCLSINTKELAAKHDTAQQTGVRLKEQEGYNYTSFT